MGFKCLVLIGIVVGIFIFSITLDVNAQIPNNFFEINKSPYSAQQNTFLNNRGFYVANYDWSDLDINTKVDQAILNRSLGKVTLMAAVGTFVVGSIYYMLNAVAEDPSHKNDNYNTLFKISGGLAGVAIIFPINARSKVKKAIQLRER